MIWVEETKDSLILVTSLHKLDKMCRGLYDYGVSFVIITDTWLVSLDCLNTLIMMKSETDNVVSDVLGQEHLHAIIEQVEEMLRTTCHTVIKALVKFTHISLRHDGYIYTLCGMSS